MNIRSMQDFELSKIWTGSFITGDIANLETRNLIYEPSKVVMSFKYQLLDLALRLSIITVRKGLLVDSASRFISKFDLNS